MLTLDTGVAPLDIGTFDTSFGSAGADLSSTISYDIPPAGSLLSLDPFAVTDGSVGSLQGSLFTTPSGNELSTPVQPAPQMATAGTPTGNSWAALLGFGAPIVGAGVTALAKSGIVQHTGANGASVGLPAAGAPLKALFDTTNQGVTGQHLVFGGIALLVLLYAVRKLA
jgi:hypothetical protein